MEVKTREIHQVFDVPESEKVIQDYRCTMKINRQSFSGKISLTQNYLLFHTKDGLQKNAIPLYRIEEITREGSLLWAGICIDLGTSKVGFSGLMHRDETYTLLNHLWRYQPTYVFLNEEALVRQIRKEIEAGNPNAATEISSLNPKDFVSPAGGRWGDLADDLRDRQKPTADQYEKVDLKVGNDALALAEEIRDIGAQTLTKLKDQAETLDRIERNLAETKNNLDRGDRILDGVGSLGGQLKNLITPDLYKNKLGAFEQIDRTVDLKDHEEFADVPILVKHSNDALEACLLRFGNKAFFCADNTTGNQVRYYNYAYNQVAAIVMRARHQHVDIRFHDGTERFRCCTAFVQGIVNEIVLRTKAGQVTVIYEPGTKKFQYGSLAIREATLNCAKRGEEFSVEGASFSVPKSNTTRLVTEAPDVVKQQLKEQDAQINALQTVVSDLVIINDAINQEAQREVDQLKKVNKTADKALKVAHKDAFRATKLT